MMSDPEMPSSPATTQAASSPTDSNQATHEDVENSRLELPSNASFGAPWTTAGPSRHGAKPPTDDTKPPMNRSPHEPRAFGITHLTPAAPAMACNRHGPEQGRNLVVCIDGTANQFGLKNSNVVELYSRLPKHSKQLTYYNSGIGTYATPSLKSLSFYKQVIGHIIDMAIAWRFDRVLLDAYRWLSDNYRPGDLIFLFGFSRGAYQIRVLAGMIEKASMNIVFRVACTLLKYTKGRVDPQGERGTDTIRLAAISALNGHPYYHGKITIQITSLDPVHTTAARTWQPVSKRPSVMPRLSSTLLVHGFITTRNDVTMWALPKLPRTKEVWFAGTHSDIGGGNTENPDLTSNRPSLRWMVSEARNAGLQFNPPRLGEWNDSVENSKFNESMTPFWSVFEIMPFKRLSYKDAKSTTWWPHRGQHRKIADGQLIHESVHRIKNGQFIRELPEKWRDEALRELDLFDRDAEKASVALKTLHDLGDSERDLELREQAMEELKQLAYTENPTIDIIADLDYMLFEPQAHIGLSVEQAHVAMEVMDELQPLSKTQRNISSFPPIIREMLDKPHSKRVAKRFIKKFSSPVLVTFPLDGDLLGSTFTFCADERTIAVAHSPATLYFLPYNHHSSLEWQQFRLDSYMGSQTLAYLPQSDGTLAVGSTHGLWLWNPKMFQRSRIDHQPTLLVAFSLDGQQMVSCFGKHTHTIQLWKVASDKTWKRTSKFKPPGHGGGEIKFTCIAFSPSGCEVVALSTVSLFDDTTGSIFVLDTEDGTLRYEKSGLIPQPTALAVSRLEDMFYVGGHCGAAIEGWSITDGTPCGQQIPLPWSDIQDRTITLLAPSPTDRSVMLCGYARSIWLLDIKTGNILMSKDFKEHVECAVWAPGGECFLVKLVNSLQKAVVHVYDATLHRDVLERKIMEGGIQKLKELEESPPNFLSYIYPLAQADNMWHRDQVTSGNTQHARKIWSQSSKSSASSTSTEADKPGIPTLVAVSPEPSIFSDQWRTEELKWEEESFRALLQDQEEYESILEMQGEIAQLCLDRWQRVGYEHG
ncbi:hypothetical protein V5O48_007452 [Marasmius crinis-equi]|uniref:T6SS Phospholipase effector Tle1-like catalytic domain-containing protein n=1 Tax=Marasmius crinis-equi TaxID=585013 RepID=A0ABR3FGN1_9AGAR